jgi:lysophospholipase L1-like esterase/energy-converting hydrogenase Eha subunit B
LGILDAPISVKPAIGGLFVALGDSITAADVDQANNIAGNAWPTYMSLASNGAIRLVRNSGIGGNKTFQMRDRFAADVAAYNPSTVIIATGTNDVSATANTLPELEAIIKMAQAAKIAVILANIPPKGSPATLAPTGLTLTPSTASGTLPAGTYGYVVTTETNQGQSLPCAEVTVALASTGSIQVDWNRSVTNDYRYRLYRRNPGGSLGFVQGFGNGFAQANYPRWNDTGAVTTPAAAPPSVDASGTANYSGILPALAANMIQTQKVIKKLARKYNVPLIDQYTLLTDPATGRFKQGYSPDGTHPTEKVQRLMGANAWAQVGGFFPAHAPFLCTDPNDYSGMLAQQTPNGAPSAVAGALLPQNVALGAGAIPMNWGASGTSSFTTNLGTDPGVAGNALTVTTTAYAARVTNVAISGAVPGHRVRVAFKIKATGIDVNGGYVQVNVQCSNKTSGPNFLTQLTLKSDIADWQVWTAEEIVPPGTTGFLLNFNVFGRNVSGSIAQVTIDDLTAQGLD